MARPSCRSATKKSGPEIQIEVGIVSGALAFSMIAMPRACNVVILTASDATAQHCMPTRMNFNSGSAGKDTRVQRSAT